MHPKPAITFRVNSETLNRQGHLVPNRLEAAGNETRSEADDQKFHRSIAFIPGGEHAAGGMPTGYKHGETFTAYGKQALYLKEQWAHGNPDDFLVVVSTDWDDHG